MCILKQGKTIQLLHVLWRALNGEWMSFPCYKIYDCWWYHILLRLIGVFWNKGRQSSFNTNRVICSYYFRELLMENGLPSPVTNKWYVYCRYHYTFYLDLCFETWEAIHFSIKMWVGACVRGEGGVGEGRWVDVEGDLQLIVYRELLEENGLPPPVTKHSVCFLFLYMTLWFFGAL